MIVLWVTRGHLYLWLMPLLAPVSTVGKSRLVVVAVQGAPARPFLEALGPHDLGHF